MFTTSIVDRRFSDRLAGDKASLQNSFSPRLDSFQVVLGLGDKVDAFRSWGFCLKNHMSNSVKNGQSVTATTSAEQSGPSVTAINDLNYAVDKALAMLDILENRMLQTFDPNHENVGIPVVQTINGLRGLICDVHCDLRDANVKMTEEWNKWQSFHSAANKTA